MSYGGAYQQHPYPGQPQPMYGQQPYQQQYQQQLPPGTPMLGQAGGYGYSQYAGHYQQYQNWQQPSQHYGQYGGFYQQNVFSVQAHQAFQFNSVNELQQVFMSEMQKNPENVSRNAIQAEDLVNILNNTRCIRDYFRVHWSREMCSIMISMLDRSQDGFMQWEEFLELQQCLVAWHNVFRQYDYDRSGYMEATELIKVVTQLFGYQISQQSLTTLLKRYSRVVPPGRCLMAFDDFVAVAVRLRAYTNAFRERDRQMNGGMETGNTMFSYDDFLRCVMCL